MHLQIFILASFFVLLFAYKKNISCLAVCINEIILTQLNTVPRRRTYVQSNELIEWQTGKLFAYLTLRNSRINVTLRNRN